ncbi:hypothetical protein SAMN05892883_1916 [Jatrophihabitans sp. GAS493]|uniref:hypothetical protein n=1 Tax=Jatrophihabitans sp. GAS493 TaxID=1907575 RepID=UPI000BC02D69|nr:hypothetical protein [Jatrophihabitans sp. GAS493]SOD72524.1 hypothetical protein SAMN05892883_1916 [Jatrophihabitans sp. GAS493]
MAAWGWQIMITCEPLALGDVGAGALSHLQNHVRAGCLVLHADGRPDRVVSPAGVATLVADGAFGDRPLRKPVDVRVDLGKVLGVHER